MTYTYNLTTAIGKVRLLAQENVESSTVFTDEELQAFLNLHNDSLYQAAAAVLYSLAANKAKLAEKAKTNDGSERDLTVVAREIRDTAARLAAQGGGGLQMATLSRPDQAAIGAGTWR